MTNNFSINCKIFHRLTKITCGSPPLIRINLCQTTVFRTLQQIINTSFCVRPTIWYRRCLLRIEMNQKCWMKIIRNLRNLLSLKPNEEKRFFFNQFGCIENKIIRYNDIIIIYKSWVIEIILLTFNVFNLKLYL